MKIPLLRSTLALSLLGLALNVFAMAPKPASKNPRDILSFDPDWRWLWDRKDSPWYPTMRVFRQPAPGDWDGAIAQIQEQLKAVRQ